MTPRSTLVRHASTCPLAVALIQHSIAQLGERRRPRLTQAYEDQPASFFQDVEVETAAVLRASGQTLPECLRDLDAFNALTPETENDAWYEQAAAFTSMHLDALLLGFSRRRLGALVEQLTAPRDGRCAVLDVGSGSGRLASMLLVEHPEWQATLLDRSAAALRFSRAYLEAMGLADRSAFRQGNLGALPFVDHCFDVVVAAEVLEHTSDPQAGVAELLRVLKPEGRLVISLPIALDIAMHPTVFASAQAIQEFFDAQPLRRLLSQTVAPDSTLDAISDVFPDFEGCLNMTFVHTPGI